ncbi:hypothetical protein Lal_00048839 [Lupinus albus]|nr:hypothetical protein Lal_00048839 [Lupinus albus]
MERLRSSILSSPKVQRKARNSWAAVKETYFLTKDTFEKHRVVFTVGTSIASVATAWFGYTLRHLHESKIDQRLRSIESAMKNNSNLEHSEIRDIVGPGGSCSIPACVATAGTTLIVGSMKVLTPVSKLHTILLPLSKSLRAGYREEDFWSGRNGAY